LRKRCIIESQSWRKEKTVSSVHEPLQGADRLEFLYRISGTFNSSLDLDQVLNHVMDEVIAATRAERGFLVLRGNDGRLDFRAARGLDQQTIEDPAFQVSRGVVEKVAHEGVPQLTSDAQRDAWLSARQSVVILGLRSILCVPLQIKGQTFGVIYVDNRLQVGLFTAADLELLTAIAATAAVAIENARLYQVAVEKGRMERELQVAREVQASLLPRQTPQIEGWEFAAFWQPAREVAGDFYDFIPGERLGLVIADVSDKGMPAALFMALSRSIVRASMARLLPPAEGIAQANRLICADSTNNMFVTLFYAQLDPATGELVYVNAGHNPPMLLRAASGEMVELKRTGLPLGWFETTPYDQRSAQLEAGDLILLYTDGVTDALDEQGNEFGLDRVRQMVVEHRNASAAELASALDRAVVDFAGAAARFDDITVVVAKRKHTPALGLTDARMP
jgi:sigma-B regulation protein RsbU (phosphoserine phosphatase)